MKPLLLILLLTSLNCFAAPPDHANNPDADDMPDQANCSFCDEPEAAIPYIELAALGAVAFGIYKLKNRKLCYQK